MEVMNPTSVLSMLETTKEQRKSFVSQVVEAVNEGMVDPRQIQVQLKCTENLIKDILDSDEYKQALVRECEKQGRKHDYHNAAFEVCELGTKYNYSVCNDPLLADLELQAKTAADKLKERQEFLKKLPSEGIEIVVGDELLTVYPPSKYSTTGVKVSLK